MSWKKKKEVVPVLEPEPEPREPRRMTFICEVWEEEHNPETLWSRSVTCVRLACGNLEAVGESSSGMSYAFTSALDKMKEKAALERFAPAE